MATGLIYPNAPRAIAFTPSGLLVYVLTDTKLLTMSVGGGATSVLAGSVYGFLNEQGTAAMFHVPSGLAVHAVTGVVFITDAVNNRVRTCTELGLVGTLTGTGTSGNLDGEASTATFAYPFGIVIDSNSVYLYVTSGDKLRQVAVSTGFTTTLRLINGQGLATSYSGSMYDEKILTIFKYS